MAETDDNYTRVGVRLNATRRVIGCRDGVQWILQEWVGRRWHNWSFCTTREVLLRCIREHAGEVDAAALEVIRSLPVRHRELGPGSLPAARQRSRSDETAVAGITPT